MRLLAALLLALTATLSWAQPLLSGEAETTFSYLVPGEQLEEAGIDGGIRAALTVEAQNTSSAVRFAVSLESGMRDRAVTLTLDEAAATAYLGQYLTARVGQFHHQPSVADLLPVLNVFTRTDYEAYFSSRLEDAAQPAPMLQLTATASQWFARATVIPVLLPVRFVDSSSVWFPNLGFPESITVSFPSETTLHLAGIDLEPYPEASGAPGEVSLAAEAGATFGPVDLTGIYYHGQDLRPLYTATLTFPEGLLGDYRVVLTPVVNTLHLLGVSAVAVVGPFRISTEHALRFGDVVLTERVVASETGFETESFNRPSYQPLLGVSWMAGPVPLTVSAEYRNTIVLDPVTRIVRPLLSHAAGLLLTYRPFGGRLSVSAVLLASLPDQGVGLSLLVRGFGFDRAARLDFALPLFFGTPTSDLGQYSPNIMPTLALSVRY